MAATGLWLGPRGVSSASVEPRTRLPGGSAQGCTTGKPPSTSVTSRPHSSALDGTVMSASTLNLEGRGGGQGRAAGTQKSAQARGSAAGQGSKRGGCTGQGSKRGDHQRLRPLSPNASRLSSQLAPFWVTVIVCSLPGRRLPTST